MIEENTYLKVLNHLQAQCSRREYCIADVMSKATKAFDGDEAAASKLVASLVEDKFVDDLRYASAFAREKAALSGWGRQKIVYMLSRKGIDKNIIVDALDEVDVTIASKRLESVLFAKCRTLIDDPQCRLKLLRFALGRGYGYDEIKSAVEKVMTEVKQSLTSK